MSDGFEYDVFLSHSAKDKAVVRTLAERLQKDGRKKNSQHSTLNSQLSAERSRVLALCMSANAFGSDWAQWESGTFQMQGHHALRDPLNKERRFLPLRRVFKTRALQPRVNWGMEPSCNIEFA